MWRVLPSSGYSPRESRISANCGVSQSTVSRIWRRNGLKPHRTKTFKLSNDKDFERKFWDVVGLYMDPPEQSVVLCCDEMTQCRALERTQPGLPFGTGHIRTRTHGYCRHGTIRLFAALGYLEGKLIYRTEQKHTHLEWLRFLKRIQREVPKELAVRIIADNYSTRKNARVRAWLGRHKRFHMHFTPHVEFVAELGGAVLRRLDAGLCEDGQLHERDGTDGRDHVLPDGARRESAAVQVEGERQGDSQENPPGPAGPC